MIHTAYQRISQVNLTKGTFEYFVNQDFVISDAESDDYDEELTHVLHGWFMHPRGQNFRRYLKEKALLKRMRMADRKLFVRFS